MTTTTAAPTTDKSVRKWEFHPFADLFPLLDAESVGFKALVEDIKANKQHDPVILFEGKILDGRNRYRACEALGIDVHTREFVGADPVGFVLSVNLHRRHLNTQQRSMVAAKLATFTHGGDRSKGPFGGLTDAAAAKLLSVSERSVTRARALLKKGDPSAIEAIEKGTTTGGAAGKSGTGSSGTGSAGGGKGGGGGGGTGGKDEPTASDRYDRAEAKLIERLKDLKPNAADAAATVTIKKLKDTVAMMLKVVASAQAA
jgi:hypothetical protein